MMASSLLVQGVFAIVTAFVPQREHHRQLNVLVTAHFHIDFFGAKYLLPGARAGMLRRLGRLPEAAAAYREALARARNEPERRFVEACRAEVEVEV
jgi:predicted RNA polymerase sigma factor